MNLLLYLASFAIGCSQLYSFKFPPMSFLGQFLDMIVLFLAIIYFLLYFQKKYKITLPRAQLGLLIGAFLFTLTSLLTIFRENTFDAKYVIKITFIFIPFLLIISNWNNLNYHLMIKLSKIISLLGLFLFFLFTFVICQYVPEIGKFYVRPSLFNIFNVSSNGISEIYVLFTLPFLLFWIEETKKNTIFKVFVLLLPFIHWSKSHLVIYVFSWAIVYTLVPFSWKKLIPALILINSLILVFVYIFLYADIQLPGGLHKMQNAFHILSEKSHLFNFNNLLLFIGEAGDYTRVKLYEEQFNWLSSHPFIGYGSEVSKGLLHGHDYHSVYFYYWVQFGLFPLLSFLYILRILVKNIKKYKKVGIFMLSYFLMKGLFSSIDPQLFLISLSVFIMMDHSSIMNNIAKKRGEKKL